MMPLCQTWVPDFHSLGLVSDSSAVTGEKGTAMRPPSSRSRPSFSSLWHDRHSSPFERNVSPQRGSGYRDSDKTTDRRYATGTTGHMIWANDLELLAHRLISWQGRTRDRDGL